MAALDQNGTMTPDRAHVLLFAPNARLWPSYRLQLSLAEAWHQLGARVTMLGCQGLYKSLCPVMLASHLDASSSRRERNSFCRECTGVVRHAESQLAVDFIDIDAFVDREIRQRVDRLMDQVSQDSWQACELDGIPFGRYASYLAMLTYKTQDVTQTPEVWDAFRIDLENSMLTYLASQRVAPVLRPSHALVFDRLYPIHRAFIVAMKNQGIPVTGMTASSFIPRRYESLVFHPFPHASQTLVDSLNIRASRGQTMTREEITDVAGHIAHLITGNDPWVYSSKASHRTPAEIRQILGIGESDRVGVVLVGSPDETRSSLLVDAEFDRSAGSGMSDVVEFVRTSVDAARRCPKTTIVVRLHPRLAPNKRERVTSPDLAAIRDALSDLPGNVVINGPGDGVGLYDVMRIADFGVNHASTSGLEFLAFGVPVVHVDPPRLNAYPPDLGPLVERGDVGSLAGLFDAGDPDGWSLGRAVEAWRWLAGVLLRIPVHQATVGTEAPIQESEPELESHPGRSARGLIPERIREWVARRLAWTTLQREIDADLQEIDGSLPPWAEESWRRFVHACEQSHAGAIHDAATRDVLEPEVIRRGSSTLDPDREGAAVLEQIKRLVASLGPVSGEGAGVLSETTFL